MTALSLLPLLVGGECGVSMVCRDCRVVATAFAFISTVKSCRDDAS